MSQATARFLVLSTTANFYTYLFGTALSLFFCISSPLRTFARDAVYKETCSLSQTVTQDLRRSHMSGYTYMCSSWLFKWLICYLSPYLDNKPTLKLSLGVYIAARRVSKTKSPDGTPNYTYKLSSLQLTSNSHFVSPPLDNSLKIIIAVLHDSTFGDKCLGKIDIKMERLLKLQRMQPNEGKYHLFVDGRYHD
jgi:hypothetical protein